MKQQRERRKRRVGRRNTVGFMMIVFILGFLVGMSVWKPGVVHAETVTSAGEADAGGKDAGAKQSVKGAGAETDAEDAKRSVKAADGDAAAETESGADGDAAAETPAEDEEVPAEKAGKKKYHKVTFDGNGKAGTLWTLRVADGKTICETIEGMKDPLKGWKKYYAELDVNGKHYKVERYSTEKKDKIDPDHPYIIQYSATWDMLNVAIKEDVTVYARWDERIDEVVIRIYQPPCGLTVDTPYLGKGVWDWESQQNPPELAVPKGKKYELDYDEGFGLPGFWIDGEEPFEGTMVGGETYQAEVMLRCDSNFYFSPETKVTIRGGSLVESRLGDDDCVVISTEAQHSPEKIKAVKPTEKKEGRKAYYRCEGCEEWFSDKKCEHKIEDHSSIRIPKLSPAEPATEKKTETPEKPRVPKDSVPETGDEDGALWGMDAMTCMWLFIVSGILLLYVAVKKRDNGDSPHCHVLPAKRDKRDCPRCHADGG